jgi:hypothetical protein
MNVGIWFEAAQFLFWEFINLIFGTVLCSSSLQAPCQTFQARYVLPISDLLCTLLHICCFLELIKENGGFFKIHQTQLFHVFTLHF